MATFPTTGWLYDATHSGLNNSIVLSEFSRFISENPHIIDITQAHYVYDGIKAYALEMYRLLISYWLDENEHGIIDAERHERVYYLLSAIDSRRISDEKEAQERRINNEQEEQND